MDPKLRELLEFWFGEAPRPRPERWFAGTAEVDAEVKSRFAELYALAARGALDGWAATPLGAVGLAVALDQLPRHLFRGDRRMFATDAPALAAARAGLAQPASLAPAHRAMLAMILTHPEDPATATEAVARLEALAKDPAARADRRTYKRMLNSARRHLRVLERFGRYPHRNALLGRETTDDEAVYLASETAKFARSVRAHAAKRLRILVLPSFRQSGSRFAARLRKIAAAVEDIAELVFLDAPHVYEPDAAERAALEADFGAVPDFARQRCWWNASDDHRTYAGWEASIRFLDRQLPADGVLGFSQGGAMAGLFAALRPGPIRFAICVSAFPSRADDHRMLVRPESIDLPSLHVYGETDVLMDNERSQALAACFVDPVVRTHPGGHFFPELLPVDTIRSFLLAFLDAPPPGRPLDDPQWREDLALAEVSAALPGDDALPALLEASRVARRPARVPAAQLSDRIWLAAWHRSPDLVRVALAADHDWKALARLARVAAAEAPSESLLDAIAARFAAQIAAEEGGMSPAAEAAPRIGTAADRLTGLGRRIATLLRPDLPNRTAYIDYRRRVVAGSEAVRAARRRARLEDRPGPSEAVADAVTRPRPVPMVPCPVEELDPLLGYLSTRDAPEAPRAFARGTVMPDGRLDLCKQVVGPQGIGPLLTSLSDHPHVTRLLLGNNVVGPDGAARIAAFVESGRSRVRVWYIAGNEIDAASLAPICRALETAPEVEGLWLKRNPLGPDGAGPVADLLRTDPPIQTVDLANTGLLDDGARRILDALTDNRTLRHLYLGTNGLTAAVAPDLARYLGEVGRLESLYLDCNRLGDEGVTVLAEGLRRDRTLRRLSLASNRIGPAGARALADALADHPSLAFLNLGWTRATTAVREDGNRLADAGCAAIAELLRRNRRLRALDLAHNDISQRGLDALCDALAENTTLVDLRHPQFGKASNPDSVARLRGRVDRNRRAAGLDPEAVEAIRTPRPTREVLSVYRTAPMGTGPS
ncbi:MAG: DUF924 family protein [Myxococcota bacterium]